MKGQDLSNKLVGPVPAVLGNCSILKQKTAR